MLQLQADNNLVMELALDGDKSHEFCMSDKQFEEVLTFVGPVITNKTGKVPQHITLFYLFPRVRRAAKRKNPAVLDFI